MRAKQTKVKAGLDILNDDKQKALSNAIAGIEKSFGKGAIMKFGEKIETGKLDVVSTGALGVDIALGVGGIPRGRIIEIFGPESSGKTTLTLHIIAEVQKLGGTAAFIDAEHALDPKYAANLGVNINELYISQPDDGEQALEICDAMLRSNAIDIIVVDSVAALVPKAEINGEMGDSHMGLHARLMSQALRKLTAVCAKSNAIIIFTNQLRDKIGVTFGNPETTTGGRALKFYASIRIDIRRIESVKQDGEIIGNRTRVKIAKNKVAPPFKVTEFDIVFGEGISRAGDVLDIGVELDIINKSGSWFSYKEERLGQGRENVKNFIKENPQLLKEVENQIREHHNLPTLEEMEASIPKASEGSPEPKAKTSKKSVKSDKKADESEEDTEQ